MKKECDRLKTIESIRGLPGQIDFNAEVVPLDDIDRLKRILDSLKGGPLSSQEIDLVQEIVKN